MKNKISFFAILWLSAYVCLLQGCQETLQLYGELDQQVQLGSVHLHYDLETLSFRKILSPGKDSKLSFLDDIASEPIAHRQSIDIKMFEDGNIDYLIEEKQPKHFKNPIHFEGVPPNDVPPIVKTKISHGMGYFYDSENNLIYEHPMEVNNGMKQQIEQLLGVYDWEREANAKGATVETLSGDNLLIRKPVAEALPEQPATRMARGKRYTEEVVSKKSNVLLGSSLHEADGTLICRVIYKYRYSKTAKKWRPSNMFYEEYVHNTTTGSEYVNKTNFYFDNFSLKTF